MNNVGYQFTDPRPEWDTKDLEVDAAERERERYLAVARELADDASIALAQAELDEVRSTRSAYLAVRKPVEAAIEAKFAADRALHDANVADLAGTLDGKQAIKNAERVTVLVAQVRHHAREVPMLVSEVSGARVRMHRAAKLSTAKEAAEETIGLVRGLFEFTRIEGSFQVADEAGRRTNAARAAWWPVAEQLAREAFRQRLADAKRDRGPGTRGNGGVFIPDEERRLPTADDLETCFARRRAAFEAEKRRVAEQLEQIRGTLQDMGGV
jgi:hypothetical protein